MVVTGDAVIEWMPFLNHGYPEEWVQTLSALETVDFTHMILGHGEVVSKEHLAFFKGYLTDLMASVKKAAADRGTLEEMQKTIPDQLAPRYEQRMSKYPLGRYRDRIGVNIETVYTKVVQKASVMERARASRLVLPRLPSTSPWPGAKGLAKSSGPAADNAT